MATKRIDKTDVIANDITFTQADSEVDSPSPSFINNFVEVVSLDGSGDPIVPSAGTYDVFYKTESNGGFYTPATNPSLTAAQTGGSASTDGLVVATEFRDLPKEIKVEPNGITGVVSYTVFVRQTNES